MLRKGEEREGDLAVSFPIWLRPGVLPWCQEKGQKKKEKCERKHDLKMSRKVWKIEEMRRWVEDEEDCPLEEKGECEALSWDIRLSRDTLTSFAIPLFAG